MLLQKRSTRKSLEERRDERVQVRNPYEGLIFIISIIDILYEQTNKLINDRNKVESYGEITIKDTIFVDAIN